MMGGVQNPDERNVEKIWKGNLTIFMRNPLRKESAKTICKKRRPFIQDNLRTSVVLGDFEVEAEKSFIKDRSEELNGRITRSLFTNLRRSLSSKIPTREKKEKMQSHFTSLKPKKVAGERGVLKRERK